jgi:hypothetical protein
LSPIDGFDDDGALSLEGNIAESGVLGNKKIAGLSASVYLMPDFLNWYRVLCSFRGDFWSHW